MGEGARLLERVLELAPDAMMAVSADGRIVLANRQVEEVFGYRRAELVGRDVDVLVPGRFRRGHRRHRAAYFAAPRVRPMGGGSGRELSARRRDGSEFRCEISLSGIDTAEGPLTIAAIRDVTDRIQTEEALRASEQLRHEALEQIVSAQDEERARISADLHDDAIQAMTAALLRIDGALRTLPRGDAKRAVAAARATLVETIERTRKLTFDLRPQLLEAEGLAAAVTQSARQAGAAAGFSVEVDVDVDRCGAVTESIVFRTLQEALANVRKHSRASRVTVSLHRRHGNLHGRVHDNGIGFDVEAVAGRARASHHLGTQISAERLRIAGGAYHVTSRPGSGTTIEFTLPISASPPARRGAPRLARSSA